MNLETCPNEICGYICISVYVYIYIHIYVYIYIYIYMELMGLTSSANSPTKKQQK